MYIQSLSHYRHHYRKVVAVLAGAVLISCVRCRQMCSVECLHRASICQTWDRQGQACDVGPKGEQLFLGASNCRRCFQHQSHPCLHSSSSRRPAQNFREHHPLKIVSDVSEAGQGTSYFGIENDV